MIKAKIIDVTPVIPHLSGDPSRCENCGARIGTKNASVTDGKEYYIVCPDCQKKLSRYVTEI